MEKSPNKSGTYKRHFIDTRAYQLRDTAGWKTEFMVFEPDGTDNLFFIRGLFPTRHAAIDAAARAARRQIDLQFA